MPWPNPTQTCTIVDRDAFGQVTNRCTRPHASRGWCSTHYKRWQRCGDPGPVHPIPRGRPKLAKDQPELAALRAVPDVPERKCSVVEVDPDLGELRCGRPHASRGFCSAHHRRWLKYGNPGPVEIGPGGVRKYPLDAECEVDGCGRSVSAKGLCKRHYERASDTGSPTGSRQRPARRREPELCRYVDCSKPTESRGLCATHYAKVFAVELAVDTGRPKCSERGCQTAVYSNGRCRRHHDAVVREQQRLARQGDTRRDANPRERTPSAA
jgi:hypothetical protein